MLTQKKGLLDKIVGSNKMVDSGSASAEAALHTGEKISPLQPPNKPAVDHPLHYFAQATGERDWPVRVRATAVLSLLQYWNHDRFPPRLWKAALQP
jgi:hypothetical protein